MKTSNLPSARAPLTDGGQPPTRPWYNFFRNINTESNAGIQAEIYVISDKLGSPDGTVENIPPITSGGVIVGPASVSSAGALPGAVTLSLVNDSASPGNTQLYGTDASGNKGWYAVSPLTTKGDLYTFDTGNNRLAIGADTYVLTADSTQATGMKWAAGGGGGGSPLTTKGDIFGFSTIAARVAVGGPGTFLGADSTAALGVSYQTPPSASGGYSQGASFPGSPSLNQKFYRTDLNYLCYYDGTRWLTCQEYTVSMANNDNGVATPLPLRGVTLSTSVFITSVTQAVRVSGTNNGSNYYSFVLIYHDGTNANTVLTTTTAADSFSSPNTFKFKSNTINTAYSNVRTLYVNASAVGSPSSTYTIFNVGYRLIVT